MASRKPIVVTAADVPDVGLTGALGDLYTASALATCAAELRTRTCPDCGTRIVADEYPGRVVATWPCPSTCPSATGITPTIQRED